MNGIEGEVEKKCEYVKVLSFNMNLRCMNNFGNFDEISK